MKFHSHAYFDHSEPESVAKARAFRELTRRTFAKAAHVEVGPLIPAPAGPHPCGSFEVRFTSSSFADYVTWLMFSRPDGLDVLVHPLTGAHVLDHTSRALWFGTPREIDRAILEAAST